MDRLAYQPSGAVCWWLAEFDRIRHTNRVPSGYLTSGKIVLALDEISDTKNKNCADAWICQVCEEICANSSMKPLKCNVCGSLQKGDVRLVSELFVLEDEAKSMSSIILPWTCEICELTNEGRLNCENCGFARAQEESGNSPDDFVRWSCPRCTFSNIEVLNVCEMCAFDRRFDSGISEGIAAAEYFLVFKSGGSTTFYEKFQRAMREHTLTPSTSDPSLDYACVGLSAVIKRSEETSKATDSALSSAFSDLDALLKSAGEMVKLASNISRKLSGTNHANNNNVSKFRELIESLGINSDLDVLDSPPERKNHQVELSKSVCRLLTSLSASSLDRNRRLFPLADIYCLFNRSALNLHVKLISPHDLLQAASLFPRLNLPWRLHRFHAHGLLFIAAIEETEPAAVFAKIQAMLGDENHAEAAPFITAVELADRYNLSIFIALEQLKMAEEAGFVVRDAQRKDTPAFYANLITGFN